MNDGVPPVIFKSMEPSQAPKQVTSVDEGETVAVNCRGSVTVAVVVVEQLLTSRTVTE